MRDLEELYFLKQFLGTGQGWLTVGFLLCLFAVLLFKPERIRSAGLFAWAWLLFALSIIAPPVLTFCLQFLQIVDGSPSRPGGEIGSLLLALQGVSGPVLFGLSLMLAFLALNPSSRPRSHMGPTKHPLE